MPIEPENPQPLQEIEEIARKIIADTVTVGSDSGIPHVAELARRILELLPKAANEEAKQESAADPLPTLIRVLASRFLRNEAEHHSRRLSNYEISELYFIPPDELAELLRRFHEYDKSVRPEYPDWAERKLNNILRCEWLHFFASAIAVKGRP